MTYKQFNKMKQSFYSWLRIKFENLPAFQEISWSPLWAFCFEDLVDTLYNWKKIKTCVNTKPLFLIRKFFYIENDDLLCGNSLCVVLL